MLTKKTEREISIRKKTVRASDQLLKNKCASLSKQNAELITESNKLTCELDTAKHYNTVLLSDIENSDGEIIKVEADHKELVAGLNDKIREYRIENSDLMDKLNSKRVGVEIEHVVKNRQSSGENANTKRKNKGVYKQEFRKMEGQIKHLEAHVRHLEKQVDDNGKTGRIA